MLKAFTTLKLLKELDETPEFLYPYLGDFVWRPFRK